MKISTFVQLVRLLLCCIVLCCLFLYFYCIASDVLYYVVLCCVLSYFYHLRDIFIFYYYSCYNYNYYYTISRHQHPQQTIPWNDQLVQVFKLMNMQQGGEHEPGLCCGCCVCCCCCNVLCSVLQQIVVDKL